MKKYAIHPGYTKSTRDGQIHYVSADDLIRLYGVDGIECVVVSSDSRGGLFDDLIHLHPRRDGKYRDDDVREVVRSDVRALEI